MATDSDGCISGNLDPGSCKYARCGDGHVNAFGPDAEQCDDGASNSWSGVCLPTCRSNVCGDGFQVLTPGPFFEPCDDGNNVTETTCPYGSATCTVCSASCAPATASGSVCGDGVVDAPFERCDDGNLTCGSCSADCQTPQSAPATGLIAAIPGASLVDGATLTIDDGLGLNVVFEFDTDATFFQLPIFLAGGDSASTVALKIAAAIGSTGLSIDAVPSGELVRLTHRRSTSFGNVSMTETVPNADFVVAGMSGGAGGDCGFGAVCTSDADCAFGPCGLAMPGICP